MDGSPCSPRDSQESSPIPQFKSINSLVLSFLYSPTVTSIHDHWKNHSLDQKDLCDELPCFLMSLLCNMLSRLIITFLPRSKHLLISWLQSPHLSGPDAMILVFLMLSFKPTFSLSSVTFIKKLFSSSSLSAIKVMSSAYLRLFIFLPAILIPSLCFL